MSRLICWAGFALVSEISPATPAVELSLWPHLVVLCWGECFKLRLYGVHGHIHLCQLRHCRRVRSGKDCIGLCQYFQLVTFCSHSLHDCLYVFDQLVVLFWRGRWCTIDVLHYCGVPAFSWGCYRSFFFSRCARWKNNSYFAHVLRSADCLLNSTMSSLKIPGWNSRVIPFEIIIASEVFCLLLFWIFFPFLTV